MREMTVRRRLALAKGLAFTSPWILCLLFFIIYPIGVSLYYSFTDFNILSPPIWIGFENFQDLFSDDKLPKIALNTIGYALCIIPFNVMFTLFVSLLLYEFKAETSNFFSILIYLPSTLPLVIMGLIFQWMYNGDYGIINWFLAFLHVPGPAWLTTEEWVKPAIAIINMFLLGPFILITLSALQNVSQDLIDVAQIEGCNYFQKVMYVYLPAISPVILFNVIIQTIGIMQLFDIPFVLTTGAGGYDTPGGPNYASTFYVMYIYQKAFRELRMGYACALGWMLFISLAVISGMLLTIGRKFVYYADE